MREQKLETDDEWGRLMRLALDGDQIAYRSLLVSITPHIRATVRSVLVRTGRGQAEVEDVVQETMLAVHLKRGTWDRTQPFKPWLNAVARYKAIDMLRRIGARAEVDLDGVAEGMAQPSDDGGSTLDTRRMLDSLDERQRSIVEQISLAGRSAAEVGSQLGMSEGAVRVALHRALKRLAQRFKVASDED